MLELNFTPFPELETERLLLRRLAQHDAPELFFLRSDDEVLKYIGKEPAKNLQEAEEFIKKIDDGIQANTNILWGIALKTNPSKLIGTICYWNIQKQNYRAEIGYVLHPQFWRQGIMKETINKIIEYGFNTMNLHSIEALIRADNDGSSAVLESTGFVKEGYLKEEFFFRGNFSDTIIYSRLQ